MREEHMRALCKIGRMLANAIDLSALTNQNVNPTIRFDTVDHRCNPILMRGFDCHETVEKKFMCETWDQQAHLEGAV
jgi:hypothetical protein